MPNLMLHILTRSVEDLVEGLDENGRKRLARRIGMAILKHVTGAPNPMVLEEPKPLRLGSEADAIHVMPGDWFSDEPGVYIWDGFPKNDGTLTPLKQLTPLQFQNLQWAIKAEIDRRAEEADDSDLEDDEVENSAEFEDDYDDADEPTFIDDDEE